MRQLMLILLIFGIHSTYAISINEIAYNPTESFGGSTNEWLELYNNETEAINLTSWQIYEPANRPIGGDNLILNSDDFMIIARNTTRFLEAYNVSCAIANASIRLDNNGEWIALKNSSGTVVANITYTNEFANGDNKTLSLAGNSWRESLQAGGTPCAQNFLNHDLEINLEKTYSDEITAHITNNGLSDENVTLDFYTDGNYLDTQNGFVASFGSDNFYFLINDTEIGNHTVLVNASFGAFSETAELNFTIEPLPNADVLMSIDIDTETGEYWISSFPENSSLDAEVFVVPRGMSNSIVVGTLACFAEPDEQCDTAWDFFSMIDDFVDFGSYELCANIFEIRNYNDTDLENNFACANFTIAPEGTKKRIKTFVTEENYELNDTLYWTAQFFPSAPAVGDLIITLQKKKSQDSITLFEQNDFALSENVILSRNITIPDDRIEGIYKIRAKFSYSSTYIDSGDSGQFWLAGLKDLGPANFTVLQLPDFVSFGGFKTIFVKFFSGNYNYGKLKFLVYGYPKQVLADTEGQGISASDFDSNVAIELDNVKRGQEIYLALPAFAKQNCGDDYDANIYKARMRAYDEAGKPVATADTNLQFSGKSSFCLGKDSKTSSGGRVGGTTLQQKQKQDGLRLEIINAPNEAELGESFVLKAKIINNLNATKTIEIYSYVFEGQKLVTEGGWTANREIIELKAKETKEIELENLIKEDAALGTYALRVRVKDGNKNIDADSTIKIKEKSESQTTNVGAGSGTSPLTGAAVYVSKASTLNPVLGLFVFLLLVLVLMLIKSK